MQGSRRTHGSAALPPSLHRSSTWPAQPKGPRGPQGQSSLGEGFLLACVFAHTVTRVVEDGEAQTGSSRAPFSKPPCGCEFQPCLQPWAWG